MNSLNHVVLLLSMFVTTEAGVTAVKCPAGNFGVLQGKKIASCQPCEQGEFIAETDHTKTACNTCPNGYAQESSGQSFCNECVAGKIAAADLSACSDCAIGTFTATSQLTACTLCALGMYQVAVSQTSCDSCPNGYFQIQRGQHLCEACPSGRYQLSSVSRAQACTECPAGLYGNTDARTTICQDCAAGKANSELAQTVCQNCGAGTFTSTPAQTQCLPCVAGRYMDLSLDTGNTACKKCVIGRYRGANTQAQTADVSSSCKHCAVAKYQDDPEQTSCKPCPPGRYENECGGVNGCDGVIASTSFVSTECKSCSSGKYQNQPQQSNCKDCEAGMYRTNVGITYAGLACINCPEGYLHSEPSFELCNECAVGKYQNLEKQVDCNDCAAGQHQNSLGSTTCLTCAEGRFVAEEGKADCFPCTAGFYRDSSNTISTACGSCQPGYYAPSQGASLCTSCPVGYFQTSLKQINCIACPFGQMAKENAPAASLEESDACTFCLAGYFSPRPGGNLECQICPTKTYMSMDNFVAGQWTLDACVGCPDNPNIAEGQTECPGCGAGEYTSGTDCLKCAPGQYAGGGNKVSCTDCPVGFHGGGIEGASECIECIAGKHGNGVIASINDTCVSCFAGKYSETTGAASSTICLPCPAGRYQINAGSNHLAECTFCPSGKRAADPGRSIVCESCGQGYYSERLGFTGDCSECPAGYAQKGNVGNNVNCDPCLPGEYNAVRAKSSCNKCEKGSFSDTLRQFECKQCPSGFHQTQEKASSCLPCMPGFSAIYKGQISCTACFSGKFLPKPQANSTCFQCPSGYGQPLTGASSCDACYVGKVQPNQGQIGCIGCPGGYVQPEPGKEICSPCLAGSVQTKAEQTVCLACAAGKINPVNASLTECTPCNFHTYSKFSGGTTCVACPAGYTLDNTGGSECLECSAGKYGIIGSERSLTPGACTLCEIGQYRASTGAIGENLTSCVACAAGMHQSLPGQASCLPCIPGRANSLSKQSECTKCEVNAFANTTKHIVCKNCKVGQFTNGNKGSADCQRCPAGTAGSGCAYCPPGKYRGNTDDAKTCIDCLPGLAAEKVGQPFCLDCESGKYAEMNGMGLCKSCPVGRFESEKRAKTPCKLCLNIELVPNAARSACEVSPVDPKAAVASLLSIRAVSKDAKVLEITYSFERPSLSPINQLFESNDKLEVQVCTSTSFEQSYEPLYFDLPTSGIGDINSKILSFVIQPPNSTFSRDGATILPNLGSSWEMIRYFRVRVVKSDGGNGPMSQRNDAWVTSNKCGDFMFLRTHPHDDLMEDPLFIVDTSQTQTNGTITADTVPVCINCVDGANCRGSRTYAQIEPQDGYKALPWDLRFYDKCPRMGACPGNDATISKPENTQFLDGGNSTFSEIPCHEGHQNVLCGECKPYYDTPLEDPKGLCEKCPDAAGNIFQLVIIIIAALGMMTFLVRDSLSGIDKIARDYVEGLDAEVPFHSVGIRIVSSFMQVAGLLNNFQLNLPSPVVSLVSSQSSISGVGGAIISFNCLLPTVRGMDLFIYKCTIIIIGLPVAMGLLVVLFWTIYGLTCHKKEASGVRARDKMVGSLLVLYYLMFPSILNGLTEIMACTNYGPRETESLRGLLDGAMSVECYKTAHMMMLLTIALPSFFVFVIIVPGVIVASMRFHYKTESLLPHQANFEVIACYRYGFLFLGYEQEFYGWEVVVMLRKASFVIVTGLLRPFGPVCQVVGASSILILALSCHLQFRPYDSDGHDTMESFSLHTSLLILMVVLLCALTGQDLSGQLGPVSSTVLICVVFVSTLVFFFIAIKQISSHSHDNEGMLGKIARFFTQKSHNDRRHSIFNLVDDRKRRGSVGKRTKVEPMLTTMVPIPDSMKAVTTPKVKDGKSMTQQAEKISSNLDLLVIARPPPPKKRFQYQKNNEKHVHI